MNSELVSEWLQTVHKTHMPPGPANASDRASQITRAHRIALLYGYPELDGSRIYNAAALIDGTGEPVAWARVRVGSLCAVGGQVYGGRMAA